MDAIGNRIVPAGVSTIPRQQSWSSRHWKSLVTMGVVGAIAVGGVVLWGLRNSDAAQLGITTAQANPTFSAQVGSPITIGWFVSGNLEVSPGSGHAELTVPVAGPRDKGTLYIEAVKRAGQWQLTLLQFASRGGSQRIDLLPSANSTSSRDQ